MNFLARWLLTAVAVLLTAWLVPGIGIVGNGLLAAVWTALALAFVNAWIKPVLETLALPLTVLSLGLFALVINAGMLELASFLARNVFFAGIYIESFGSALLGSIVIAILTAMLGVTAGEDE